MFKVLYYKKYFDSIKFLKFCWHKAKENSFKNDKCAQTFHSVV